MSTGSSVVAARHSVVFQPLYADAVCPSRKTERSAGYDLFVYLKGRHVTVRTANGVEAARLCGPGDDATIVLTHGDTALLPLGFRARLPKGWEAQIRMRSSWAFRRGLILPNAPGTIDADYPHEWMVMVRSDATQENTIAHGDRVAQAVLSRFEVAQWVEGVVGQSSDRTGGFGSTG